MICKLLAIGLATQVAGGQVEAPTAVNVEPHNHAMSMGVSPEARAVPEEVPERDRAEDLKVFHARDADKSGYLEAAEMDSLMSTTGVAHLINWRSFDRDGDGKLSQEEFVQAGPAVVQVAQSLGQDVANQEAFLKQQESEYFKQFDKDKDGFLNATEMPEAIANAGVKPESINWRAFDHDGDGRMTFDEFNAAGPAVARAFQEQGKVSKGASRTENASLTQIEQQAAADRSSALPTTTQHEIDDLVRCLLGCCRRCSRSPREPAHPHLETIPEPRHRETRVLFQLRGRERHLRQRERSPEADRSHP